MLFSSLKYNISFLDYFYFRFVRKKSSERQTFAGTGFMYEYQLKMNPQRSRDVLLDKKKFLKEYQSFVSRFSIPAAEIESRRADLENFLQEQNRVVLKRSKGQVGRDVFVMDTSHMNLDGILVKMRKHNFDLLEEYIVQHPSLMQLSPSGLNTVRIITQFHQGKIIILAARLRISVNSSVDNLAAGNLAASIDLETGKVTDNAIYSDITKEPESHHPVTGVQIKGFQIPYWHETLQMTKKAALLHVDNRSIGWDLAITSQGPELVEGNHNWCKLLWQLPVQRGLKNDLIPLATD